MQFHKLLLDVATTSSAIPVPQITSRWSLVYTRCDHFITFSGL